MREVTEPCCPAIIRGLVSGWPAVRSAERSPAHFREYVSQFDAGKAKTISGIFARLDTPIDYEAVDSQPVDLVFMLLAPENAGADHLKALAKVSRLPGDHSELRSEAENLEKIQSSRPGGFDSIPRLVALSEDEDHSFLIETMLTG